MHADRSVCMLVGIRTAFGKELHESQFAEEDVEPVEISKANQLRAWLSYYLRKWGLKGARWCHCGCGFRIDVDQLRHLHSSAR